MTEYRVYRLVHFILGGPDLDPPRKEIQLVTTDFGAADRMLTHLRRNGGQGAGMQSRSISEWREVER